MTSKNKNIEKRFLREFENLELQPSPRVWEKVSYRLAWKEFMRFEPFTFNIYYAIVLLGIVVVATFLLFTDKNNGEKAVQGIPAELPVQQSIPIAEELEMQQPSEMIRNDSMSSVADPELETSIIPALPEEPVIHEIQLTPEVTTSVVLFPAEVENAATLLRPIALFRASSMEGCMPLKVWFSNYSVNALQYSWSFGDGGTSDEKDPVYVFDEPGTYFVRLTTMSEENSVATHNVTIEVYELPEVRFEVDVPENYENGFPVYFYNYTRGASEFRWDFGDGNITEIQEPVHSYQKPGTYDIKLVAKSSRGCMDSTIISDVFKEDEPEIRFPTAFTPNMSGGTGGYFSGRERNNEVFYAYTSEQPVEYLLRIFNRHGNLIFESNDINMGWDGYYRQELQPAGVYVWKVRARFADGRTLVKAGDITLFWRQP